MRAIVTSDGKTRQLDRQAEPEEQVTPEQVQDPERLARGLMGMLRELAKLRRRFHPRRIDFEDRAVDATGTTKYRFPHTFGGRVRWSVVGWKSASAGPQLVEHSDTSSTMLVLVSYVAGTATVRVEEAG